MSSEDYTEYGETADKIAYVRESKDVCFEDTDLLSTHLWKSYKHSHRLQDFCYGNVKTDKELEEMQELVEEMNEAVYRLIIMADNG